MLDTKRVKRRIAKIEGDVRKTDQDHFGAWFSLGWRVALEWSAAVLVGYGMGRFLDWWLDIDPWALITFLLLGNIAGLLNIYRTYRSDVKTF